MNFKEEVIIPSVERGAELLDEIAPGWANAVNLRLLNLAAASPDPTYTIDGAKSGTGCILCQLDHFLDEDERIPNSPISLRDFGDYNDGLQRIADYMGHEVDGSIYGFDIIDEVEDEDGELHENPYDASHYYSILDKLWKNQINRRLKNGNKTLSEG